MTTKVFDTFTGTVGTDLGAHTPDTDIVGGGWTDEAGNSFELDGSGACKANSQYRETQIDVGTADQWATANCTAGGAANSFLILSRNAGALNSNGYGFLINPNSDSVVIFKVTGGGFTSLSSGTVTMDTSTTYELRGDISGSSLELLIDGASEATTTDSTYTSGNYAGLWCNARFSDGLRIYDFQVNDAAPAAGGGRIMGKLAGQGSLAGLGGIAGIGGGLAG